METMVVLARSQKHGGYCLAGKLLDEEGYVGEWVRPVDQNASNGLLLGQICCEDDFPADVLDVVTTELGPAVPQLHQRENRLVSAAGMNRSGQIGWEALGALADETSGVLWFNGSSSGCGQNDRVPSVLLPRLQSSLRLVAAKDVCLRLTHGYEGRPKYRASFSLEGHRYNLALTDPVAQRWLSQDAPVRHVDAYLCISLAVPFQDGFAYKLVASVITQERAGETH